MSQHDLKVVSLGLFVLCFLKVVTNTMQSEQLPGNNEGGGHCIWYGECGRDTVTGKRLNCEYKGPAKRLDDADAIAILRDNCPDLSQATNPLTCCSVSQLYTFQENMSVFKQLLYSCPACVHNFISLFCQMTCSPQQSKFIRVADTVRFNRTVTSVTDIKYTVSKDFSNGMYNSCKSVTFRPVGSKAIGIICGRPASQCNASVLLNFIGSMYSGASPVFIDFNITNVPVTFPDGTVLTPMNTSIIPCSSSGPKACQCDECEPSSCTPGPYVPAFPCFTRFKYKSAASRSPFYIPHFAYEHLIITHKGKDVKVMHQLPPPSVGVIEFDQVFNKTFFHQVLDVQNKIETMFVSYNSKRVSINDICLRNKSVSKNCISPGPLQYYQQRHKNIDKKILGPYGFFVLADYLDHFLSCVRFPEDTDDYTALHMSCRSNYNGAVSPKQVLCGYDGVNYQNSTGLVATYIIKSPKISVTSAAWRNKLIKFVKTYSDSTLSLSLYEVIN